MNRRVHMVYIGGHLVQMFALDQSIVSTAIPVIVSDFNAFDQVAWIITGYFCMCVNILPSGRSLSLTTFSDPMWSYSSRRTSAHDPQGEMDAPWCNFLF